MKTKHSFAIEEDTLIDLRKLSRILDKPIGEIIDTAVANYLRDLIELMTKRA